MPPCVSSLVIEDQVLKKDEGVTTHMKPHRESGSQGEDSTELSKYSASDAYKKREISRTLKSIV